MGLTIKNIQKILFSPGTSHVNVKDLHEQTDTYKFIFTHRNHSDNFGYRLHRDLSDGINGANNKYVGTFTHPFGSNRQDCYEADILDKNSFLYFLEVVVNDWAVQYKQ